MRKSQRRKLQKPIHPNGAIFKAIPKILLGVSGLWMNIIPKVHIATQLEKKNATLLREDFGSLTSTKTPKYI